ncbi:hypothetical protein BGW80DRAFT_1446344 [Lactifluus volemus]|nr:hypothetical protein BGW80DRAFT_1446344 [Lactifluus volemus]
MNPVHLQDRKAHGIFQGGIKVDSKTRTPVRKMLDIWPPLPIEIRCFSLDPQAEDNIIAALEHPNRLRTISLRGIAIPLERLVAVTQEPFPAMETLDLRVKGTVPALPNTFLGGSAPRLRSLHLEGIPLPTLPRLLLTSNDLFDLTLDRIPQNGYISPETMVTCISALTRLTNLSIGFESPTSRPDPTTRHSPPLTRAVLPALTSFFFHGVSEYLEDLMAQIDAPLLHWLLITFFNQLVFDIQQLIRFIGHAPALTMPYDSAVLRIHDNYVQMIFRGRLGIDYAESIRQVDMDDTQWLELLQPFTAVQTLRILSHDIGSLVVPALRRLSGDLATQVLPALEELQLSRYRPSQRYNWPFIIARQHSDHLLSSESSSSTSRKFNVLYNPSYS